MTPKRSLLHHGGHCGLNDLWTRREQDKSRRTPFITANAGNHDVSDTQRHWCSTQRDCPTPGRERPLAGCRCFRADAARKAVLAYIRAFLLFRSSARDGPPLFHAGSVRESTTERPDKASRSYSTYAQIGHIAPFRAIDLQAEQ